MDDSIHRILKGRILEWVAISFSRGSSQPRDQTWVSCIVGGLFTIWTTMEALLESIVMTKLDRVLKGTDITLLTKIHIVKAMTFPVIMYGWDLEYTEGWALKNWFFRTVVLEKTLESPLDCKEIKPVNPKEYQPWIFIRRIDTEVEAPILWPPMGKLTHWKRPWSWERYKAGGGGDNRGQDGWIASLTQWTWVWTRSARWWRLACCSPWGCKESDMTEQMKNSKIYKTKNIYTTQCSRFCEEVLRSFTFFHVLLLCSFQTV